MRISIRKMLDFKQTGMSRGILGKTRNTILMKNYSVFLQFLHLADGQKGKKNKI